MEERKFGSLWFPLWLDISLKIHSHALPEWLTLDCLGIESGGGRLKISASLPSCVHFPHT